MGLMVDIALKQIKTWVRVRYLKVIRPGRKYDPPVFHGHCDIYQLCTGRNLVFY